MSQEQYDADRVEQKQEIEKDVPSPNEEPLILFQTRLTDDKFLFWMDTKISSIVLMNNQQSTTTLAVIDQSQLQTNKQSNTTPVNGRV